MRRNTPSSDTLKAKDSSREKIMSKKLGTRTQTCFTQLLMEMWAEDEPSNGTVPFILHGKKTYARIEQRNLRYFSWHSLKKVSCTPFKPGPSDVILLAVFHPSRHTLTVPFSPHMHVPSHSCTQSPQALLIITIIDISTG